MRKFPFQRRKSSNCIKVRKPNFIKLRKELFEKGLQRNCKKNISEFDVDKDLKFFKIVFS